MLIPTLYATVEEYSLWERKRLPKPASPPSPPRMNAAWSPLLLEVDVAVGRKSQTPSFAMAAANPARKSVR